MMPNHPKHGTRGTRGTLGNLRCLTGGNTVKDAQILRRMPSITYPRVRARGDAALTHVARPVFPVRMIGKLPGGGSQVAFTCPHCRQSHVHGWPASDPLGKPQHRQAHCTRQDSAYLAGGYLIVLAEAATSEAGNGKNGGRR